eukprot:TRINITY_DN36230_c0_g1_i1.p1 TRINITY_DN36230_c0_g1~~TRINITY_DN36230_c0_g1_i1.p1  ORF type:complete len:421 (+),score=56.59 TRINITY_DN36230_c0_g1_i1:228-1490(+)
MRISAVILSLCAAEMLFWVHASASETIATQHIPAHLSNTKKIHLEDPPVSEEPVMEFPLPAPEPAMPKNDSSTNPLRQPHVRHTHDVLKEPQPQQRPPRWKAFLADQENGVALLAATLAAMVLAGFIFKHGASSFSAVGVVRSGLVWAGVLALPLCLNPFWERVFPSAWCTVPSTSKEWPSALGLSLGLLGVAVGQLFVLLYHWLRRARLFGGLTPVQAKAVEYEFGEGMMTHLAQPEGFVLMGAYLTITWMFRIMPDSYYNFYGGVQWPLVLLQLLVTDATQFGMHMLEHIFKNLYKKSHKPHHRFTNPRLFDAFNGSWADTCLMILLPLVVTAQLVHCNLWSYIAFGTMYANWLTLIHSEWHHPWDQLFRFVGAGTPADHHVHHAFFVHNYGHLFLYWDRLFRTYKNPQEVTTFNMIY